MTDIHPESVNTFQYGEDDKATILLCLNVVKLHPVSHVVVNSFDRMT